ncbi:MAG: nuclear transport factor 2 family protein [Pseudonocardiaceae bacterium]
MGQAADAMHRKIAAFNAQDGKEFQALMGPDIEWAIPGALLRGPDQVAAFNSALWKAFPDIKLTATRVAQDGAIVVICRAEPKERITGRSTLQAETSRPPANA